jgi:hypothetical protein
MWTLIGMAAAVVAVFVSLLLLRKTRERKRREAAATKNNRMPVKRMQAANDNDVRHRPNQSTA